MATSSGKLTCYGSNGAVDTGAIPCNPQAKVSTCCPYTNICYSNGLCALGPGLPTNGGQTPYYTGYCTDRTWSNGTACPSVCNNQQGADIVGNGLQFCGSNAYCCYNLSDANCCETSSLIFSLAAITSSTSLPPSSSSVAVTTSSFSASTDATATTSSSLVSPNPPLPTVLPATLPSASASTSASISPSIPPSTLPSASPPSSNASTNHFAAGIGAGIGIGAALLFLIGTTFIIRKRRTRIRAPQTHENPAHGEKPGITNVITLRNLHEMEGEKPTLAEPDGQHLVEIDDTRGNTWF